MIEKDILRGVLEAGLFVFALSFIINMLMHIFAYVDSHPIALPAILAAIILVVAGPDAALIALAFAVCMGLGIWLGEKAALAVFRYRHRL